MNAEGGSEQFGAMMQEKMTSRMPISWIEHDTVALFHQEAALAITSQSPALAVVALKR